MLFGEQYAVREWAVIKVRVNTAWARRWPGLDTHDDCTKAVIVGLIINVAHIAVVQIICTERMAYTLRKNPARGRKKGQQNIGRSRGKGRR